MLLRLSPDHDLEFLSSIRYIAWQSKRRTAPKLKNFGDTDMRLFPNIWIHKTRASKLKNLQRINRKKVKGLYFDSDRTSFHLLNGIFFRQHQTGSPSNGIKTRILKFILTRRTPCIPWSRTIDAWNLIWWGSKFLRA